MSTLVAAQPKQTTAIVADSNGDLPTTLQILKTGVWRTPYHGDFMISSEDLQEYVDNFNAGIGLADGGSSGAPIDFSHENAKLAAAWIKKIYVDGDTLMAEIKWSKAGREAILNDEYKFFSPEFYPKGRGGYQNPEDMDEFVENVLVGGGLTNIPLFKALSTIKASISGNSESRVNVEYINASEIKEQNIMTLEEIRVKSVEDLSAEEKTFLTDNQAELSNEDKTKFGFEIETKITKPTEEEETPVAETTEVKEAIALQASVKAGEKVVMAAAEVKAMGDRIASLEASKEVSDRKEASQLVDKHIARGAVKADAKDKWVDRLVKADKGFRTELESTLNDLGDNPVLASTKGDDNGAEAKSVVTELDAKAKEIVKASNGATDYKAAINQARTDNPELAKQYDNEVRGQ